MSLLRIAKYLLVFFIAMNYTCSQEDVELKNSLPEILIVDSLDITNNLNGASIYQFQSSTDQSELHKILKSEGIAIKSLGPGQLSTISVRGTYASSQSILWEGVDIGDPLVGIMNFSNFSVFYNDQISFEHHGNGKVGSVINISQIPNFDSLNNIQISGNILQYGLRSLSAGLRFGRPSFASNTEFQAGFAKNNFIFNSNVEAFKREHNEQKEYQLKQSLNFNTRNHGRLGVYIWLSNTDRNIPAGIGLTLNDANQQDRANRFLLKWKLLLNSNQLEFLFGFLNQRINYNDATLFLDFMGKTNTYVANVEWSYYPSKKWLLKTKFGSKSINAFSTGFPHDVIDNQFYLKAMIQRYFHDDLSISLFSNYNYAYAKFQLPTVGLKSTWKISKSLMISNVLENFIQLPSFNDLYWEPGGNRNLKASSGYGDELGIVYMKNSFININLQIFQKYIKDQLLWLPQNGYFSAYNVPLTWSRGLSLGVETDNLFNRIMTLSGHYHYTKSTYLKSRIPNDNVIGKQLIFIPRHQVSTSMLFEFNNWGIDLINTWVGKRFTSSDNSSYLNPYNLIDVFINYNSSIQKKYGINIKVGTQNLLNEGYQLQNGWPMPGRQWMINLQINTN